MAGNPQVLELLEEMLESGRTPEEVCRDCPELLAEVREQWNAFCRIDPAVGEIFPALRTPPDAGTTAIVPRAAVLPQVPGYEVGGELGRGGMGVVYKARHLALKRTVALKMLAGSYSDQAERTRFKIEAEAVARLQHPNIVQVHEIGEAAGLPFLALEFVEGGSLARRLAGKPLPPRDAARLVETLADAMHLAHSRNLVHRDLKPANILLTGGDETPIGQCQPKVTDFGLARQLDADSGQTQVGVVMGTPSYMAPEQAEGRAHAAGPAADVYSLGATLYECLTGRPPFHGATPMETLLQVRTQEPAWPSSFNRHVPRDLETICLKCLRKQPEQRYSSARELGMDLGRFLRGEPVTARPVGVAKRCLKWVRRRPAVAGLLAAVVLLAAAGLWLVQQRAQRRTELRNEVGTAVAQAESLREGYHFQEARQLLDMARQRLGPAGPDELLQQVKQARADLDLAENLDAARLRAATPVDGRFGTAGAESPYAESLYEQTLAKAGLGGPGDDISASAARVRDAARRAKIVGALDDWASMTPDPARRAWLLAVARGADPDPIRDRLRQPELWDDGPELTKLVKQLPTDELSPQLATALGRVLLKTGGDAAPLLSAVQARYPQDFWLNFELGWALYLSNRNDEALGFYRAALALRPEASPAYDGVGASLQALHRWDEAEAYFKQALSRDPNFAMAHLNLGMLLRAKGRTDESLDQFQAAARLDPTSAQAHHNLGCVLREKGRSGEAVDHFQEALRLEPNSALIHYSFGLALGDQDRQDEAIDQFREAIRLDPNLAVARQCLFNSQYAAACAAVRAAAGQGPPEARPGEQEQVRLRRRALDWLRADLELRAGLLKDRKEMSWSLTGWQTNPALAGARDATALAKLPDAERAQWQRLWVEVAALVAADPLVQGRERAARGDWARAAHCYARAVKLGATDDGHFWFEYAALLLLSGDRKGYENGCARLVERYGKAPALRAYHVARACTLAADAVADASLPGRLAETELQTYARQFWSLTERGALAYRAGRFQEAVASFEQSLKADATPGRAVVNWLWLALANERLGKAAEAQRWLVKAQKWLDQFGDGMPDLADQKVGLHFHNWLEAHVLRCEAEALLPPQ